MQHHINEIASPRKNGENHGRSTKLTSPLIDKQFFFRKPEPKKTNRSRHSKPKSQRVTIETTTTNPPLVPADGAYTFTIDSATRSTHSYKKIINRMSNLPGKESSFSTHLTLPSIPKELSTQMFLPFSKNLPPNDHLNRTTMHANDKHNDTLEIADSDSDGDRIEFQHDSDSGTGDRISTENEPNRQRHVATQPGIAPRNSNICEGLMELKKKSPAEEDIVYSPREKFWLELAGILQDTNAPKYLFKDLSKWAMKLIDDPFFQNMGGRMGYTELVNRMASIHGIEGMRPTNRILRLPGSLHSVSVVKFNFLEQIFSLLTDTKLMRPENLIWGKDKPNKRFKKTDHLGDVHTTNWFIETQDKLCTSPMDVLVPLIEFIDRSYSNGNCWEPASTTLGIFVLEIRQTPEAWRHLGFIPGLLDRLIGLDKDAKKKDKAQIKTVDYHFVLRYILSDLIEIDKYKDGVKWVYQGEEYNLKFAVMNVIGDIEGFDKLNARKRNHNGPRMTFACDIKRENCMNPYAPCTFHCFHHINSLMIKSFDYSGEVNPLFSIQETKDAREELNEIYFYHGIRNAFTGVNFGANENGLNSACCVCMMHTFKEKFPDLLVDLFLLSLGRTEDTIGKLDIETSMPRLITKIRKQSARNYPRISKFAFRLTKGQIKYDANQKYARVFALYIFSLSSSCRNLMIGEGDFKVSPERMNKLTKLLEYSLSIYEYMYQERFPRHLLETRSDGGHILASMPIREFLAYYQEVLEEISPSSEVNIHSIFPKLHYLTHVPTNILIYGSARNFDGGASEGNFRQLAKKPARKTQRRADSIDIQLCNNYADDMILRKALDHADIKRYGSKHLKDLTDSSCEVAEADDAGSDIDSDEDSETGCFDELPNRKSKMSINSRSTKVTINFDVERRKISVNVKQNNKKFTRPYPRSCLEALYDILIYERPRILQDDYVDAFTCLSRDGLIYRAHPSYRSGQEWYDYANFRWQTEEGPDEDTMIYAGTPGQRRNVTEREVMTYESIARIFMFVDLRNCTLHPESTYSNAIYALVKSVELNETNTDPTPQAVDHWVSCGCPRLAKYWTMEDNYRLVKASFITSPCFALEDYEDSDMTQKSPFVVEILPFKEWKYVHNEDLGCDKDNRYD